MRTGTRQPHPNICMYDTRRKAKSLGDAEPDGGRARGTIRVDTRKHDATREPLSRTAPSAGTRPRGATKRTESRGERTKSARDPTDRRSSRVSCAHSTERDFPSYASARSPPSARSPVRSSRSSLRLLPRTRRPVHSCSTQEQRRCTRSLGSY